MFDILLSDKGTGPLYMRLYQSIREQVENGGLRNGKKLPSVRAIQQQLRVSKTTVESAYQLLVAEGHVISKPKSGFIVVQPNEGTPSSKPRLKETDLDNRNRDTHSINYHAIENKIIDFSLLDVDKDTFPAKAWRSSLTEAVTRYSDTLHEYGEPQGEFVLRRSIAQYLRSSRGVICEPEQIVIGSGISYSLFLLTKLWGSAGAIAFEERSIAQVGNIFAQHGFRIVPSKLISSETVQAAYVTPSHRPSGQPLTNAMKAHLLQWAVDNQAFIVEDDYDGEFRFRGRPVPSLQGADQQGVVIYVGTFSKAFTPALRMNYMVLPRKLLSKLHSIEYLLSSPSRMDQLAMSIFMERGHWYRHIKRIRKRYREKQDKLIRLIEENLSPLVQVKADGAGLHVEMTIRFQCDRNKLIRRALEEGVRVYGSQDDNMLIEEDYPKLFLGFGGISDEEMAKGINLLKKAWMATEEEA